MATPLKKQISSLDRLSQESERKTNERTLLLNRNLAFGAAAACLVILSQLVQEGPSAHFLEISATAAAIGMPLWIVIGSIYEIFIILGKGSYPYLRVQSVNKAITWLWSFAGICLVIAIAGIAKHISERTFLMFITSIVVSFYLGARFYINLGRWLYGDRKPGEKKRGS